MSKVQEGVVYGLSDTEYHAIRDHISSSPLPEMRVSPLHFLSKWTAAPKDPTPAMKKGTFIHSIVLEQEVSKYVARPVNEKGDLVRSNSKEYAEFLSKNEGKEPIEPDLYNEAMAILDSAIRHTRFCAMLGHSEKEVSFFGTDKETGLKIKARADVIAGDFSFIVDLKSTARIADFQKQIFNSGYDLRIAHYIETIYAVTGKIIPEVYFFAIESSAPFASKMFKLRSEDLHAARAEWRRHMNNIAVAKQDNFWPGYSEEIIEVVKPSYLSTDSSEPMFGEAI